MSDHVYLAGSEDVARAGHNIADAAREITRAVENISAAFAQHQRFMDDWLEQLRVALQEDRQYRIAQR
jgi:hypothetical protein